VWTTWATPVTRAVAFLGAVLVAVGALLALGSDPGFADESWPSWLALLGWSVLATSLGTAGLVLRRGVTPGAAGLALLTAALASGTLARNPEGVEALAVLVVASLGVVGTWHLDPRALVPDRWPTFVVAGLAVAAVGEVAVGAVSTALWLLPFLWGVGGLGFLLASAAAVATARTLRAAGGLSRYAVGLVGLGCVGVAVAPLGTAATCSNALVGCVDPVGYLTYSLDFGTLTFTYATDPCSTCTVSVPRGPVLASVGLLALGIVVFASARLRRASATAD